MIGFHVIAKKKLLKVGYSAFDLAVIGTLLALAGLFYVYVYGQTIVSRHPEKLVMQESSIVLASDGTTLRKIPLPESGYRKTAKLEEMPKLLVDTFLAVEDRRFYLHQGLDYKGIGRALLNNTLQMRVSEGGSSITQQLARNLYLNREQTLLRKLNEASIALALEKRLSKRDILEMYLNQIYMGEGQYGVKAAAEHYFGITNLKDLDIMQIASLAAIPKGPSIYHPGDPDGFSVKRRGLVLSVMRQQGLITQKEMATALQQEYHPPATVKEKRIGASYIDAALEEAARVTGKSKEELQTGGYTIVTGLNTGAQQALEETFSNPDLFPPNGKDQQVEAAMAIIDHRTGEVVALTGGRNPAPGRLNRAVADARQPGSAFKPIIDYGPALESGMFTPESLLPDRKAAYGSYRPENLNGVYRGQVTMKTALQQSINAPAVWLLKQVGISKATAFAAKLGIELPKEDRNLSIALGGLHAGISPLKMAQAYNVFASGGVFREAHMVRLIKDSKGKVVYEYVPRQRQAISPATAERMTAMLRSVVYEGTGKKARLNRPVAGKTGTTQLDLPGVSRKANRDLWFVGYTSEWTAAVWMGFDRTDQNNYMTEGSGKAAALFAAVMRKAFKE
ncbi:PBP1A family penicillin-binding protein [Paenibacillus sp. VCA1]|uniref:transglycosylase domain-containing protein n=1 Tax=Paenibacillus sp. VCA1 TaxID=3039148 RepID=UPI002870F89D|nr:PBP1A family penicillin-binding protein [Paenibacillus sp. VCA1]MDR9857974.1 PBP1A family penicillin-binding protein [Paenibacillus sp. VCA1]